MEERSSMLLDGKLLIGKTEKGAELSILPQMANRHGIITGASGSGKTDRKAHV